MILLTDEEIQALLPPNDGYSYYVDFGEAVAKAQLKKVVERIKDKSWLSFNSHHDRIRVMWDEDWEAILKECE